VPVARKQDDAAHQWVRQALAVGGAQGGARNVDDQGSVCVHGVFHKNFCSFFNSCLRLTSKG
jgi:hypothetical protein